MFAVFSGRSPLAEFSVALTTDVHSQLERHLLRNDGEEDLAFLVWKPSRGADRETAVVQRVVFPLDGDRFVHGNVSFASSYFLRACAEAAELGGGVGLIHSHPGGRHWQGMSSDDFAAESGHAAQAMVITGLPMIGLTMAGRDTSYSARIWRREATRRWTPQWARNVRVVGERLVISRKQEAAELSRRYLRRTIDTWGEDAQRTIASLRVGIVGAGSVGSQIIESLSRTGFGELVILDFDAVEDHNLDRILNATKLDARRGRAKAEVAATAARRHSTNPRFLASWSLNSAVEEEGLARLKDCDLIFSCVDRPAGRAALNALAYAHLIPVVDGGVLVDPGKARMRGAEWRAHVAGPGRRCLECLGQFDAGEVQADRDGLLDDPSYLASLPQSHLARRGENVFAFSAAAAAGQVLAALRMIVAPAGVADVGAELTHFVTGLTELDPRGCDDGCIYTAMTVAADAGGAPVGQRHVTAELARRSQALTSRHVRFGRPLGQISAWLLANASRDR